MERPLAVITGASSGIGSVFARRLAATHDLLLVARRVDRLDALADALRHTAGCTVSVMVADLSDDADVGRLAVRIAAEPMLELLVNNAGFGSRDAFWKADLATLENMNRLQVMAILTLTHAALGVLVRKNRGSVINVASVASFAQRSGSASYGATKSWLAALTEGIYLDLKAARSNVRVQALCPGFTYSGFHDALGENRARLAPPSLWHSAEDVVDTSLKALRHGPVFVVPGWRYRLLLACLRMVPLPLKLRMESLSPRG